MEYKDYLEKKTDSANDSGFDPVFMPDVLFPFQRDLVTWALKKGRAAIFADCGLGKSPMELVWCTNVVKKTGGKVLLLTPIAVGKQMEREATKFGVDAKRCRDGEVYDTITITNYEQLHHYNPSDFTGVCLDESSILKNFKGQIKTQINQFVRTIQYRLLATATAAPNDFVELGTSSEALGYLGYMDMLGKFFKNDQNNCATNRRGYFNEATKWRLKGHAHDAFWRWVCSWARAVRKPSDLGYSDDGYNLPKLEEIHHKIDVEGSKMEGFLFSLEAIGLKEQRDEIRATLEERCKVAADIVKSVDDFSVIWCNLNDEGDLLEKIIPDSVQVSGKDSDEKKEEKLVAFSEGRIKKLIIKPKIGAFGLNWQHCNHMVVLPTHSYEQYYQCVRRAWRFGQKREVKVDLVFSKGYEPVVCNLERKKDQASEMFERLVAEMNNAISIDKNKNFNKKEELPTWL